MRPDAYRSAVQSSAHEREREREREREKERESMPELVRGEVALFLVLVGPRDLRSAGCRHH